MTILAAVVGVCLVFSWLYYLLCLYAGARWAQSHTLSLSHAPPVTLLKPIRGADPEQAANFESFCHLDYPEYQIVFGALDPDDPGLATVRELAARTPGVDIAIVANGAEIGFNRKVSNLAAMLPAAKHELLVLSDSDMRVSPDYLRRVAAPFTDAHVGLVTCPYRGNQARGLASSLEALGIGADFIPSAFVAYTVWRMRFAFGSTIAIRRDVLEKVGGFEALANELADDYRLAERAKAAGFEVILSDYVVDDVLGSELFADMWSRRLRWAKTARAMRPGPYAGSFITHGTVLALLFAASTGFSPAAWLAFAATFVLRAGTATWIARRCTYDDNLPRLLPLLPISDLVSFALFIASFFGRTIFWRGERFRLARGGRLERGQTK